MINLLFMANIFQFFNDFYEVTFLNSIFNTEAEPVKQKVKAVKISKGNTVKYMPIYVMHSCNSVKWYKHIFKSTKQLPI